MKGDENLIDGPTAKIAEYIGKKGVAIVAIARATGISEGILRRCLSAGKRNLRAGEFLRICEFLERDPMEFSSQAST